MRLLFQNKGLIHSRRQAAGRTVSGEHRAAVSLTVTGRHRPQGGALPWGSAFSRCRDAFWDMWRKQLIRARLRPPFSPRGDACWKPKRRVLRGGAKCLLLQQDGAGEANAATLTVSPRKEFLGTKINWVQIHISRSPKRSWAEAEFRGAERSPNS